MLQQDIGLLVQDAEGIRSIYKQVKDQIPSEAEASLQEIAFIEHRQRQVLQAQKRLSDRANQADISAKRDQLKQAADGARHKTEEITSSQSAIADEIDQLKAKQADLEEKLAQVKEELKAKQATLAEYPSKVTKAREEWHGYAKEAVAFHKSIKNIFVPAEDDQRTIDEADQIRIRALTAIRDLLKTI